MVKKRDAFQRRNVKEQVNLHLLLVSSFCFFLFLDFVSFKSELLSLSSSSSRSSLLLLLLFDSSSESSMPPDDDFLLKLTFLEFLAINEVEFDLMADLELLNDFKSLASCVVCDADLRRGKFDFL